MSLLPSSQVILAVDIDAGSNLGICSNIKQLALGRVYTLYDPIRRKIWQVN